MAPPRGKKMGLGDFLGDQAAAYIPEAALPTGPRPRDEFEDERNGGRGGYGDRRGGDRFGDREQSRSDQSDQWRGDRAAGGDRGGFGGDRRAGGSRFGGEEGGDNWRGGGGGGGPSRYERPSRDNFQAEERPAHMRLNLSRRADGPSSPRGGAGFNSRGGEERSGSDDKFASAFGGARSGGGGGGSRFGDRGSSDRFGDRGGDRFGDRGGDRFGDRGGDRFGDRGGDRFGDRGGDRFGDRGGDRFGDRGGDRFGRGGGDRYDDRDSRGGGLSSAFGSMRVGGSDRQAPREASPSNEEQDKKARAQKMREERKKKAEEERIAAEEAKRAAAEAKKAAEEAEAAKADGDRSIMAEVLASGKTGDELAKVAKDVFAKSGRPSGAVIFEAVTKQAEAVAKASANWIAPTQYGGLLKSAMANAEVADQVKALYALQIFLNEHDFPKGVMEKCFMALYSLDIIEEKAFFDYKYDVDSNAPGRMKAIVQISNWLTWLETPEEESDEEDE